MSVFLVRPRVADLVFQVYGRPLHPELFEILATQRLVREDYRVQLQITRTGHVITFDNADVCLTEVAAAVDQELPEKRRLLSYRMKGEHCGKLDCLGGLSYQMSFQVEVMQAEVFLHTHEDILAEGLKRGLLHHFQPHQRLGVTPLSLLATEARARSLTIFAFHTFPAENTVVKSQTLIERR